MQQMQVSQLFVFPIMSYCYLISTQSLIVEIEQNDIPRNVFNRLVKNSSIYWPSNNTQQFQDDVISYTFVIPKTVIENLFIGIIVDGIEQSFITPQILD